MSDDLQDDDPLVALKKLKQQSATPDPLDELKALKAARPVSRPSDENNQPTADELAAANQGGAAGSVARHVLNTAQGLPGMKAVEAGFASGPSEGAKGSQVTPGISYPDAYSALSAQTKRIGGKTAAAERFVGSLPAMAVLPGSPALAGATLGAADQALDANPDRGVGSRAAGALGGAAAGGFLGKAAEGLTTGVRALFTPNAATNVLERTAARKAAADVNFPRALAEGQGRTDTPNVQSFLGAPDIAEIQGELLQGRPLAGAKPNSPEVLDAIFKVLSDRQNAIRKGLDAVNPSRPNIGRFTGQDIALAKEEALNAMSGGSMPGPMPSYRPAVADFARQSRGIEAVENGQDALKAALSKAVTAGRNLDRTTPEAFADWVRGVTPAEAQGASEGILGGVRQDFAHHPVRNLLGVVSPVGGRAIAKAPELLRATNTPGQRATDILTKLGLLGVNSDISP